MNQTLEEFQRFIERLTDFQASQTDKLNYLKVTGEEMRNKLRFLILADGGEVGACGANTPLSNDGLGDCATGDPKQLEEVERQSEAFIMAMDSLASMVIRFGELRTIGANEERRSERATVKASYFCPKEVLVEGVMFIPENRGVKVVVEMR